MKKVVNYFKGRDYTGWAMVLGFILLFGMVAYFAITRGL